ncbi:oligosaccharide flippase family protein [Dehalobacter sp.]|uniref:oligosaccharide flippase family protein n=1 Tax=Dehalobacter sp. TaxID=1962289 RepID=UPI00258B0EDA|nr:oligosaccharide flippase family protein [Dehalobacter sp.]MDJ0304951.1 oligosaccharide flippase family protein [Dehalobacter sp.]
MTITTKKGFNLVIDIIKDIKKSAFYGDTAKIIMGTTIAQILSIILIPITSRLYGPVYYGEFGVFTAAINSVNGLVCLGLISAIVSPEDDEEASVIYKICLMSCSTFAIVIILITTLLEPYFHVIEVSANYSWICGLMGIFMLFNNWATMSSTWGNRKKQYHLLMFNPIISSVVNFLTAFSLGMLGYKEYGLIVGAILSQVAVLIHLLLWIRPFRSHPRWTDLIKTIKKYKDFPKYQMPSNFLQGFGGQLPIIIMSIYFGTEFVGQYNMGQKLLYVPITIIGSAMGQVHFKQATDLVNNGQDIGAFSYKVIRSILLVAFVPLLACAIFGESIFEIFLGSQWTSAGIISQIRSYEFLFVSMYFSVSYILVVLKRQKMNLVYTISLLIWNNLAVLIGGSVFNNSYTAVVTLSIGGIILNFLFLAYAFSQTALGMKKYLKLIVTASVLFMICAVAGNMITHFSF